MVFLAAMPPEMGKSFLEQLRADPTVLNPEWIGKDPSRDDAAAMHFLFHDCSPEVAKWALTTRIHLPLERVANEVYPLQRWPAVAASYIVCSEDRTINPEWSRRAARERLGVRAIEFPAGHCPHLSQPKRLAELLSNLASRSKSSSPE
jgi:pimeloyl-ACP methyl ester carboxylesterase